MTKEVTKAAIMQEIQDKFKLREFEPAIFAFSETVIPVYNVESHLEKTAVRAMRRSVSAIGGVQFFAVPPDERWWLNGYNVVFLGAGAFTVSGVYITRTTFPTSFFYLDLTAGQTVSYGVNLPNPLLLQSGDKLSVNIDGYTSPQDLDLYIDVIQEEIR